MSDTTMVRVSTELRDKVKAKAKAEGRTLEWMLNDALSKYMMPKPHKGDIYVLPNPKDYMEPTVEPFEGSA